MTRCRLLLFLTCTLVSWPLSAQTEIVRSGYFPAHLEFSQLTAVLDRRVIESAKQLDELSDGSLYAEAGFRNYSSRTYEVEKVGLLTVEIITLKDAKAAYSLFTLLRPAAGRSGPPGDHFSSMDGDVILAQSNILARLHTTGAGGDLAERVARSVSNRIGRTEPAPSLVMSLPAGLAPSSLRYFLGPLARTRAQGILGRSGIDFQEEVEVAQADYTREDQTGTLSLVAFPTSQASEEFFDDPLARLVPPTARLPRTYLKRAGPLLGILEGGFSPRQAEAVLGSIRFRYSIKWIFDKKNDASGLRSVSTGIMSTVVRSLLFTVILCVVSIIGGIALAAIRLTLRGYAPGNFFDRPERTEMIRLKINES